MTNLCIENYGVSNLKTQEMKIIDGGGEITSDEAMSIATRTFAGARLGSLAGP